MGVANFFNKTALSASQVLQGFNTTAFRNVLASHVIEIRFREETFRLREGKLILDLLTRLLARLYPHLQFSVDGNRESVPPNLFQLAQAINPEICGDEKTPTIILFVGPVHNSLEAGIQFFLGSDRWLGFYSKTQALECADSSNPFGAGFAACIGAANVFRTVFKDYLPAALTDEEIIFSVFNYSLNKEARQGPELETVHFIDTVIVGLGAIGNSITWALSQIPLSGRLDLVDNEVVDLSNLQRYVLTRQEDIGFSKVDLARSQFLGHSELAIRTFKNTWKEYLELRADWKIQMVGAAVDSAQARIDIQAALPLLLVNGWTQMEQIGVSRHFDFMHHACLACLYFPGGRRKHLSEEIAENLNMASLEQSVIRKYLADGQPVDQSLLELISFHNGIAIENLAPYMGKRLEIFHSEVVCGGVLMQLTGTTTKKELAHVPSAFESALTGIFVAAELVIESNGLRKGEIPALSKLNLMRPLTKYTTEKAAKHSLGRCICQDPFFLSAFRNKWYV